MVKVIEKLFLLFCVNFSFPNYCFYNNQSSNFLENNWIIVLIILLFSSFVLAVSFVGKLSISAAIVIYIKLFILKAYVRVMLFLNAYCMHLCICETSLCRHQDTPWKTLLCLIIKTLLYILILSVCVLLESIVT